MPQRYATRICQKRICHKGYATKGYAPRICHRDMAVGSDAARRRVAYGARAAAGACAILEHARHVPEERRDTSIGCGRHEPNGALLGWQLALRHVKLVNHALHTEEEVEISACADEMLVALDTQPVGPQSSPPHGKSSLLRHRHGTLHLRRSIQPQSAERHFHLQLDWLLLTSLKLRGLQASGPPLR